MSTDLLAERYGTTGPRRRGTLVTLVTAVVLLFGVWLAWTVWEHSQPVVASGDLTFSILDDNTATASVVVDLEDPGVDASCRLKAYAEDHSLVGQVDFAPQAGGGRITQEISTDRRATSVELEGCTAPGQPRPR